MRELFNRAVAICVTIVTGIVVTSLWIAVSHRQVTMETALYMWLLCSVAAIPWGKHYLR